MPDRVLIPPADTSLLHRASQVMFMIVTEKQKNVFQAGSAKHGSANVKQVYERRYIFIARSPNESQSDIGQFSLPIYTSAEDFYHK